MYEADPGFQDLENPGHAPTRTPKLLNKDAGSLRTYKQRLLACHWHAPSEAAWGEQSDRADGDGDGGVGR